uniref:Uncharacterized protein n=1 Tax=Mantoniella antarctica TaxID=81844 RepID=A0A6U3FL71_9CHLO|mmetsp:Transcript_20942/g.51823  ORF Transcript_20942/g.51823 Transcript_20942/m.51823 type:complete len:119 (+) Transcript_20942:220-576(+)|eukprot:CAMPEP_0181363986 /NCGR_PEP_ID=MMETSP1106-20121128/9093_1 /TAXON_ID=81844 /ORGANISM="Mantoniella antarctica, Strain SL-175" /LENGTH=118 /DNA_ID=CAMNT_0023478565 /DNA_START=190 /DNA_END=546 /DNA_ORIENTATION=+
MTLSLAQQMLRRALSLRCEAVKAFQGAEGAGVTMIAFPKRVKNLMKKAAAATRYEETRAEEYVTANKDLASLARHKGWAPAELGLDAHRAPRKFKRSNWEHALIVSHKHEDNGGKLAF